MCDVRRKYHRVRAMMVHRYTTFINFQAGVHNVILELKKDPTKEPHQGGFMITYVDVNLVVQYWPVEWCILVMEKIDKRGNQ